MDNGSVVSVPHVAFILGITIPHAQELLRNGIIPGHKTAKGWYTTRSAVEVYQAKQQKEAQRPKKGSSKGSTE